MADLNNHISVFNFEYEILTHEGFKDFKGVIKGNNHNKIELELSNGRNLICTPKHKIYKHDMQIAFAEDSEEELLFLRLIMELELWEAEDLRDQRPCIAPLNCIRSNPF